MSQFSLKMEIADNRFFTGESLPLFSRVEAQKARAFHKKLAGYEPTPLCDLKALAAYIGVKNILVKDESKRFGLNAFKMLGGSTPSPTCSVKNTGWRWRISPSISSSAPSRSR